MALKKCLNCWMNPCECGITEYKPMKIKLYFIQQIHNEAQPHDCVGKLHIFKSEEERYLKEKELKSDEYNDYYTFEKEIEL